MLSQKEIEQVKSHIQNKSELPNDLKMKMITAIKNGEQIDTSTTGQNLCCDTGMTPPNRYIWTTFDNCRAIGGRAADNSMCGH